MAKKKEKKDPSTEEKTPPTYLDTFLKIEKEPRQRVEEANERARENIEKNSVILRELEKKLRASRKDLDKKMAKYRKIKQKIEDAEEKKTRAKSLNRKDLKARKKEVNKSLKSEKDNKQIKTEGRKKFEEKTKHLLPVIRAKRLEIMELKEKIAKENYKIYLWNIEPALSYLDHIRRIKDELEEGTQEYMYQIPIMQSNMKNTEKEVFLAKGYPEGKEWQISDLEAVEELFLNPIVNEKHFQELAGLIEELEEKGLKDKEILITYRQEDAPGHASGFKYKVLKKIQPEKIAKINKGKGKKKKLARK